LKNDTSDTDDATNDDSHAATKIIGNVGEDRESDDTTNGHDGVEKTELRIRGVLEVVLPVR
jgi:hypothetical protein